MPALPALPGTANTSGAAAVGDTSAVTGGGSAAPAAIGGVEGWFLRGTIIVLGFIFVGVGLAMFRNPSAGVVEIVKNSAAKVAPGGA